MRKKLWIAAAILSAAVAGWGYARLAPYRILLPNEPRPPQTVLLSQNWTDEQRAAFHHTAQGTRLLPWDWFMALEQPCLSLFSPCGNLADPQYLTRFGFIPSDELPSNLPIGFARQHNFHDPLRKINYPVVGITCAACHTGELFYKDHAIRIEGGPGLVDLASFQRAVGLALGMTTKIPGRYGRFEFRVLGANGTEAQKTALRRELDAYLASGAGEFSYAAQHRIYDNPAGFGRTDALTRIGNQVFAVDLNVFANFRPANAAVRFPQIWDAPWFTWIQYNASIADPLVRNIGEALGVRALLNPADFDNSVDVAALNQLETIVAGASPYTGLASPRWPAIFPKLDPAKVRAGEALYGQHCQGCHLPPPHKLAEDYAAREPRYWERTAAGVAFLKVTEINIQRIGTDPRAAFDFRSRTADSGPLNRGLLTAAEGLDHVTRTIANDFFDRNKFSPQQRLAWTGYRTPGAIAVRDRLVYKARPLNGIWAAAPYLHNGSVPSLYHLLSPHTERPRTFYTGTKRYDPEYCGYETAEFPGGYLYDTAREGNSNTGHEFNNGARGNGIIGPLLSPGERWALIEYLKSL